ncbi:MAG: lipid II:glycine glycyltransferase FemX [bacterium]
MQGEGKISPIDPLTDPRWDDFVHNHRVGTVFHTSKWARVIRDTYQYEPCYFILEDSKKNILAGLPFFLIKNWWTNRRLVALPFTDECAILLDTEHSIEDVIMEIGNDKKVRAIEIRSHQEEIPNFKYFRCHSYYKLFRLDLTAGIDALWKGFKQKSIRYPIKKSQNLGVHIEKNTSADGVNLFYRLNLLTRKKHGVIPQPYTFFKNIYKELINSGMGFILVAIYHKRAIAASLFFHYKDTLYHKFNASDSNYLKYQPNHLILWEAIKWGVENGFKVLDLGRTSPDNYGLMSFKRHWGAKEIDLPYYYWPDIKGVSVTKESSIKYKIASSILKRTPIPVLKLAGTLFYKYLG